MVDRREPRLRRDHHAQPERHALERGVGGADRRGGDGRLAHLRDRLPAHQQQRADQELRRRVEGGAPLQGAGGELAQAVPAAAAHPAAVDPAGGDRRGDQRDERGRRGPEGGRHDGDRRLHRARALDRPGAALQGRRHGARRVEDRLHADARGGVRRAGRGHVLARAHRPPRGPEGGVLHADRRPDPSGAAAAAHRRGGLPLRGGRARGARRRARGRACGARLARAAGRDRRALGAVDAAERGHDADGGAAHRDALRRGVDRVRCRHRLARAGEAGGPAGARRRPAGEHPELDVDPVRDEERRAVRRRHAGPGVAHAQEVPDAVLGDRARGARGAAPAVGRRAPPAPRQARAAGPDAVGKRRCRGCARADCIPSCTQTTPTSSVAEAVLPSKDLS